MSSRVLFKEERVFVKNSFDDAASVPLLFFRCAFSHPFPFPCPQIETNTPPPLLRRGRGEKEEETVTVCVTPRWPLSPVDTHRPSSSSSRYKREQLPACAYVMGQSVIKGVSSSLPLPNCQFPGTSGPIIVFNRSIL